MKTAILCVISLLFFLVGCEVLPMARISPSATVTVKVTDQSGNPLAGAKIDTDTFDHYVPAAEWGGYEARYKSVTFLTDKQGVAVVKVKLPHDEGESDFRCRVNFPGYYADWGEFNFTNSLLVHWLPLNPEVDIAMQKIGVQTPMYAGHIFLKKIPDETKPVGFDLMVGDWVEPYGKGKTSDFIFHFEIAPTTWITNFYGSKPIPKALNDWKRIITFPNDGDGIQTFAALQHGLRSLREAPLDGYESSLTQHEYDEPFEKMEMRGGKQQEETYVNFHPGYQKDRNYFFRIRTKKDENGNIVSALYGKIYGDFNNGMSGVATRKQINFTYFLNPEPNSRNMEFNPQKNLLLIQALETINQLDKESRLQNWTRDDEDKKEYRRLQDLRRDSQNLEP